MRSYFDLSRSIIQAAKLTLYMAAFGPVITCGFARLGAQVPIAREAAAATDAVGPGDLLDLRVADCIDLTHSFRVGADGRLMLPLVHASLLVAGLTPEEISVQIRTKLLEEHVLVDPVVSLSILELQSRPVSVVGAVNHPLTFQANSHTTLIDAIARAQGLSPTAGGTIVITSLRPKDTPQVREVAVSVLLGGNVPAADSYLHGGEEVRVLEAPKIFVAGNVRRPGMYPMQGDADTTVVKALALSSGLDQYSAKTAFIYRRMAGTNSRKEIEVPLKQIIKRHSPDVALVADDILYIPTNDGRRLTGKILSQIAGFGQTAEAGLLVVR